MKVYAVVASCVLATFITLLILDWIKLKKQNFKHRRYIRDSIFVMDMAKKALSDAEAALKNAKDKNNARRQQPED